jgi:hypothetical protein
MTKNFHLSDVLTITTGRLVSTRHMDGVYEILNWMTDDNLFTHQLPRASRECAPVLCALYPSLSEESLAVEIQQLADGMKDGDSKGDREALIAGWLNTIRAKVTDLPFRDGDFLPIPRLKDGQHLHIDPVEELGAMVGDDKVIVVEAQ